jgi:hypothetical protein
MPDASHPQPPRPLDWNRAFAALPQEAPPAQAWDTLSARLEARRRTRRWPAWLALAATLALLALLPLQQAGDEPANGATAPGAAQVATAQRPAASTGVREPPVATAHVATTTAIANPDAGTPPASTPDEAARILPSNVPAQAIAKAAPQPSPQPSPKRVRATAAPATDIASADATAEHPVAQDAASALQPLYAESAQLETLLALARDDRVASASAVVVADALDAQVAGIDASLSDPAVDDARRLQLWQARVDALRQAVGFEGTQRLLVSQGRGDALLASVD